MDTNTRSSKTQVSSSNYSGHQSVQRRSNIHLRVLTAAVFSGALIWLIDSLLDYFVFFPGASFLELLITSPPQHELYIRMVILIIFLLFGLYAARLLLREHNIAQQLRQSLDERELLLREIHHRVKNNLLMVSSLVGLHMSESGNPELQEKLDHIRHRIDSIALVHSAIYRDTSLSSISLDSYLQELLDQLLPLIEGETGNIRVKTDIQPVQVDLDTAVPCALITNELLQNAFEHAFPPDSSGTVTLSLHRGEEAFTLSVSDDGRGFPASAGEDEAKGLGLSLVESLTEQVHGKIELPPCEKGATVSVTVPVKDTRRKN